MANGILLEVVSQRLYLHGDESRLPAHELDEADASISTHRFHFGSHQSPLSLLHSSVKAKALVNLQHTLHISTNPHYIPQALMLVN